MCSGKSKEMPVVVAAGQLCSGNVAKVLHKNKLIPTVLESAENINKQATNFQL